MLCHLNFGPFAVRVFRLLNLWLDEELWHEGIKVSGRGPEPLAVRKMGGVPFNIMAHAFCFSHGVKDIMLKFLPNSVF
jgi:hypothetical protein